MKILRVNEKQLHIRTRNIKSTRENPQCLEFALRLPSGNLVGFEKDEDGVMINLKTKAQRNWKLCSVLHGIFDSKHGKRDI